MGYAFISYSSRQQKDADRLRLLLNSHAIETWMAPYDIPSGQDYTDVVSNAIQNAACLVLLLTEDAQNSVYVDKEIERALHYGKTIAPIQLGSLTLNDSFSFYLCNQQIEMLPTIDDSTPKMQNLLHHLQYLCNDRLPPKEETLDATRDKRVRRQKTARLFRWLGFILLCVSLFCGHQYVTMISWVSYTELYGTSFIPTLSKVAGSYCLFFFLAVVAVLSWLYGSGLKDIQKNTWSFFGVLPLPQLLPAVSVLCGIGYGLLALAQRSVSQISRVLASTSGYDLPQWLTPATRILAIACIVTALLSILFGVIRGKKNGFAAIKTLRNKLMVRKRGGK